MAGRFVLAIDQGTTGTTTYLIDRAGRMFARGYCDIEQHYPRPGWVEHDPIKFGRAFWSRLAKLSNRPAFPFWWQSASPTNAKRPSYGTAIPALP